MRLDTVVLISNQSTYSKSGGRGRRKPGRSPASEPGVCDSEQETLSQTKWRTRTCAEAAHTDYTNKHTQMCTHIKEERN